MFFRLYLNYKPYCAILQLEFNKGQFIVVFFVLKFYEKCYL